MVSSRKCLFLVIFFACLFLFVSISGGAIAAPITGDIYFSGTFVLGSGSLSSGSFTISSFQNVTVTSTNLAGSTAPAHMYGFSYPPGTASPLWTAGVYEFDLGSLIYGGTSAGISMYFGTGTLKGTGYQDTLAAWTFFAKSDGTWTLNTTTGSNTAVPEPSLALLMGIGIFGVAVGYKRLAK